MGVDGWGAFPVLGVLDFCVLHHVFITGELKLIIGSRSKTLFESLSQLVAVQRHVQLVKLKLGGLRGVVDLELLVALHDRTGVNGCHLDCHVVSLVVEH